MYSFTVILFFCVLGPCAAHMCMTKPQQRGSLPSLYKPADVGATDCYLMHAPCGGRMTGNPVMVEMNKDRTIDVILNKNLDHFNKHAASTGSMSIFEVNIIKETIPLTVLATGKIADDDKPSLSNYTISVPIPGGNHSHPLVLQAIYKSNSHLTFYQCADIKLIKH